jgi:hypothetical protein
MSKEEIIIQEIKYEMQEMKERICEHTVPDYICGYLTAIMTIEKRLKELEDIKEGE